MKKLIFLCAILFTITASSQLRRNDGYPDTRNNGGIPELKPEKLAGLLVYDIKKACKKISVKRKSDLGKKIADAIAKYNRSIQDIKRINTFSLRQLKTNYKAAYKIAQETRDPSSMNVFRKDMKIVIDPIRKAAANKDSILNVDLKALLNKKQFKKWIKYSNNVKRKANPFKVSRQPIRSTNPNRRRGF